MMQKREFVLGMMIGSAMGAAVAILYAPQDGSDTRALIRHRTTEAKEKVASAAGNVKQTVGEKTGYVRATASQWVDKTKGAVTTKKEQVVAALDAARQAARENSSDELHQKVEGSIDGERK
jgi:gas vesicle protein